VCYSELQCAVVCCRGNSGIRAVCGVATSDRLPKFQCVAVCRSVLQYGAVCRSVLQCVAVCCSELQCVAVCYVVSTRDMLHELRGIFRKGSPLFVGVFCKRDL